MKQIKVGAAVLNQTALDWEHNLSNILGAIEDAQAAGVSLLCLPELAVTGYGCEDAFHSPSLHKISWELLHEIVPAARGLAVAVGLPVFHRNALFNTACLIANGAVAGFAAKQHLAGDGIHYEPRFFKPWPAAVQGELRREGLVHPIGDLYFDCEGVRIGFEICEDAWVASRPGSGLAQRSVDIILNPSASHFAFGKHDIRRRFVQEGSRAFGVSYVYANLLGNDAGRVIYDGGAMIASLGQLVATGPRLRFADRHLITAVIDIEATRMNQSRLNSFKPNLSDQAGGRVPAAFMMPEAEPEENLRIEEAWDTGSHRKEEEFSRTVALALFDYLRKSHSKGFVVSLSGGVDSAAVACLVHLMVRFGMQELGTQPFLAKAGLKSRRLKAGTDPVKYWTGRLLACAYQATANSSKTTRDAALGVAEGIGAEFHDLDVDPMVRQYVGMIEGAIGRKLRWDKDDVVLQNIQARVRSPGIWMLANIRGALLLSTSNRSEAAVGYATMDGDTSGGLSPIAGIDKAFLRGWLRWMETTGPEGVGAFPFLKAVNDQQPTAELRPLKQKQTDEDDLMPYDLLDAIERSAIRDKRSPEEILREMHHLFPRFKPGQLRVWIRRFFDLWCRNQWKRERYAPSFHVDDKNLDPKTWCRFPILSGGYSRELSELDQSKVR